MQTLSLEQMADYLQAAKIENTFNLGFAIVHSGTNEVGAKFVMLNDYYEQTVVTEGR